MRTVIRALLACVATCLLIPSSASAAAGREYIIVIDVSASRDAETLKNDEAFVRSIVNSLTFGDKLVLLQMREEGLTGHPLQTEHNMPNAQFGKQNFVDQRNLKDSQLGVASSIHRFFTAPNHTMQHTDVLTTLAVVGESVREAEGRPVELVLLSDMLQSTHTIEMERAARMPPANFVNQQRATGLLPTLQGACVVVVGADATNAVGAKVRKFWMDYFSAAGATLNAMNYRATAPQLLGSLCR